MGDLKENVQVVVEINGNKALSTLNELDLEAKELRKGLKGMKKGTEEYVAKSKELDNVTAKQKKLRNEIGLTALPLKDLKKQAAKYYAELKQLTPGTEAYIKKSKQLSEVRGRMSQLNKELKGTTESQQKLTGEWKNMLPISGQIDQLSGSFGGLRGIVLGAVNSFGLLKGAIIATGIGALVIVVTALFGWFTKTKKGTEQLAVVMAVLGAVTDAIFESFNQLISYIGEKAYPYLLQFIGIISGLVDAFIYAKDSFVEFFSALFSADWSKVGQMAKKGVENVFNGIKATFTTSLKAINTVVKFYFDEMLSNFKAMGKIAEGIFTLDLSKIKEGISSTTIAKGLGVIATGFEVAAGGAKALGDNISEDVRLAIELANRMNRLVEAENLESLNNAKRKKEIQELIFITRDRTKSFEEQEAALIRANEIELEGLNQQLKLQKERAAIAWADDARADSTEEDTQKAREESIKLINLETQSLARQRELLNRLNELRNKIVAEEKKQAQERLKIDKQYSDLKAQLLEDEFAQKEAQIRDTYQRELETIEEGEYLATERRKLLEEARDKELQELSWARKQEFLEEQAVFDEEQEILIEEKFQNKLITEQERENLLYELKRKAMEKQLGLVVEMYGKESAEAQKVKNEIHRLDNDHKKKLEGNLDKATTANEKLYDNQLSTAGSTFTGLANLLSSDENLRKKHFGKIKAMQGAGVLIDGYKEVAAIWKHAMDLGPVFGPILGAAQTGIAVARTSLNLSKINSAQYGSGGLLLSGPSHSQGGMPILDPSTGSVVAEVEGGEPILSVDTYNNNKPLVDALLYTSMHRAGASLFEDGGILPQGSAEANVATENLGTPTRQNNTQDTQILSQIAQQLAVLTSVVQAQQTMLKAYIVYDEYEAVKNRITEDQNEAQL
ncbi:hypothetical protein [Flammeovirga pacifica]|uniref:Bacteriophage tail tape measure N-terminal domain-containing protein n=1 Tax=Flammeovirga pacifica TaxID=915059 RepID=A0A1S1Z269_FLAPC|nr:hypothetical protein [Flammeovirga pacifica]OHX67366.1 hypothetical protein NH26_13945 [Flammeovirga pacifica]